MRSRNRVLALAGVAACAAGALALTWTWVGRGADPDWDTCENWNWSNLDPCWPSTTNDNAVVPVRDVAPPAPWTINVISEQIRDLAIQYSVNFGAAAPGATLEVDGELSIQGGDNQEVVVTMTGANIVTVP